MATGRKSGTGAAAPPRDHQQEPPQEQEDDAPDQLVLDNPRKTLQHLFLQALISRRTMPLDLAQEMYSVCANLCGIEDPEPLHHFAAEMEPGLSFFGLDLKQLYDAEKNQQFYVLINTVNDDVARLATEYLPQEIAFFRVVIQKIMEAGNLSYSVSNTEALRCVSDETVKPTITKMNAQILIKSLVARGWLNMSPTRYLTLSGRALAELGPYLRNTFTDEDDDEADVKERVYGPCALCNQLVTLGWACPSGYCGVRLHKACVSKFISRDGKCPGENAADPCNKIWSYERGAFIGDPIGRISEANAEPEPESDPEEEDELASQLKKRQAKAKAPAPASKKGKGKQKANDGSTDEEPDAEDSDADSALAELGQTLTQAAAMQSRAGRAGSKRESNWVDDDADMSQ